MGVFLRMALRKADLHGKFFLAVAARDKVASFLHVLRRSYFPHQEEQEKVDHSGSL
jgi:hypothetical protein